MTKTMGAPMKMVNPRIMYFWSLLVFIVYLHKELIENKAVIGAGQTTHNITVGEVDNFVFCLAIAPVQQHRFLFSVFCKGRLL